VNRAHRRTWGNLAVSVAGILLMSGVLAVMEIYDIRLADSEDHTALRVMGVLCTIPLILIAILQWGWKKIYDERDLDIERRSMLIGGTVGLCFLGGGSVVMVVTRPLGTIDIYHLPSLFYITCFVLWGASAAAALILYGRGGRDE